MGDEEPLLRPRVQEAREGQVALGERPHPAPRQPTPLAPAPEGAVPAFDRVVPEGRDRRGAHRHGVVGEPAAQDLAEPAALRLDPVVAGRPEPLLDLAQLRPHPLADRRPPQHEAAPAPPGRAELYLRRMLIHGARAALPTLSEGETPLGGWLRGLLARAHVNKVVVALAAKLARIVWAVLRSGQRFEMRAATAS